jgi:hypothetical protein
MGYSLAVDTIDIGIIPRRWILSTNDKHKDALAQIGSFQIFLFGVVRHPDKWQPNTVLNEESYHDIIVVDDVSDGALVAFYLCYKHNADAPSRKRWNWVYNCRRRISK